MIRCISGSFAAPILVSFLFQCGYILMMSKAYTYGDISQVYPIMRGTGTLLIPLCSALLFHEYISIVGWLGIGCIVCGVFATVACFGKEVQNRFPFILLHCAMLLASAFVSQAIRWSISKLCRRPILVGAVLSPGSYLLFLFAMKLAPLATIAPNREANILLGCSDIR